MGRMWQMFVAPGPEDEPLPAEPLPWVEERSVILPREQWVVILDFARRFNEALTEKLSAYSLPVRAYDDDDMRVPREEAEELIQFMNHIAEEIEKADPLVPEPTEEIPDAFGNEEHARMVRAVAAVYSEALRRDEPFRAWVE